MSNQHNSFFKSRLRAFSPALLLLVVLLLPATSPLSAQGGAGHRDRAASRRYQVPRHRTKQDHRPNRYTKQERHAKHRYTKQERHAKHRYTKHERHAKHRYTKQERHAKHRYTKHERHRSHYRVAGKHAGHHYRDFVVPDRFRRGHYKRYKSYYHSRIYYGDHGHYHRVYRFPVYEDHRWIYRPHAYCDGAFFALGRFTIHGPRFSLSLRL